MLEDQRKGNFIRIYPSKNSDIYEQYFTIPRTTNKMLYKYLFTDEIMQIELPRNFAYSSYSLNTGSSKSDEEKTQTKLSSKANRSHTSTESGTFDCSNSSSSKQQMTTHYLSSNSTITPKFPEVVKKSGSKPVKEKNSATNFTNYQDEPEIQNTEKLLITGDDVLIEYVARLMIAIKSIREKLLRQSWKHCINKFICHYVWHTSDTRRKENNKLWQRLESRLIEMKERRKRLLKSLYKNEATAGSAKKTKDEINLAFEKDYETKEQQK